MYLYISIVDAFVEIYNSDTYSRLENESIKLWHLGSVALYEIMVDVNVCSISSLRA
jgi:hypothetical protein